MFEDEIRALEDIQKNYGWNSAGEDALRKAIKALRVMNNLPDQIKALRNGCGLMNDAYDNVMKVIEEDLEVIND